MALPQIIDFRGTNPFVTDPPNAYPQFGTNQTQGIYPNTTAQGNNVGWTINLGASAADRSAAVNAQVAGINYMTAGVGDVFRVDLPASGAINVGAAFGDQAFAQVGMNADFQDNGVSLFTVMSNVNQLANQYWDATGTLRTSDTDWVSNNATKALTMSTTSFMVNMSCTAIGTACVIATLAISAGGAAAVVMPPFLFMEGEENLI